VRKSRQNISQKKTDNCLQRSKTKRLWLPCIIVTFDDSRILGQRTRWIYSAVPEPM